MSDDSTTLRLIRVAARAGGTVAPGLAARWLERLFLTPSRHPMPPREADWMSAAQRHQVHIDGVGRLPCSSWGDGPAALLVHGWSGRGSQMGVFAGPLVERGWRVVTFDAPGHGEAEARRTGLPETVIAVEHVAARFGPVQAIVAHSAGAAAVTLALSRGLSVERLVFIAPPEDPGDYLYRAARFLGFGDAIARRAQERIERRYSFPFERARTTTQAPTLRVPLLVVHDRNDPEVPYAEGARLAEAWPGAELMTTAGLGHNRILREPTIVDAAVEFLCAGRDPGCIPR